MMRTVFLCAVRPDSPHKVIFMPETHYKRLVSCEKEDKCNVALDLAKIGKPAYQYIVQSLADDNEWVRMFMAEALGNIGDAQALPNLLPLLKDKDQMVRFMAADAIGNLGSTDAIPYLEEVCREDNCFVRVSAEEAIEKILK